jgi:CDP-glucose 4,6-dehydratase
MGIWSGALENLAMTPSFWQGKSVFITGHTGFKGSWLSLWLQQLGAKVIGFSLPPPSEPNLFTLGNIAKNMTHIQGDIQDSVLLQKSLMQHQPDIIFHMAAQSLVQHSYDFPVETYAVNVMGTVNLLEAVRQCKNIKAVINITSDKCYENKEWEWGYRENEPLGGYDPYSSSKACAELVTSAYRQSFFGESSSG